MKSFHRRTSRPAAAPALTAAQVPAERKGLLRADSLLVAQGLAPSRTAAQVLIEAGRVRWEGGPVTKSAQLLSAEVGLEVEADDSDRFVSRGGLKLAGALVVSKLDVARTTCLDVGQSTGGFTDCLLQAGAKGVIGVEVGHGQIHPRLTADPRCITLEGINARHLQAEALGEHFPAHGFDIIVCDASFISLALLLPQWPALLAGNGNILALVKPQFEVGPQGLSKGGIVRNTQLYVEVESRLRDTARTCGLSVNGWFDSPITGTDGNREFFIWMQHEQH